MAENSLPASGVVSNFEHKFSSVWTLFRYLILEKTLKKINIMSGTLFSIGIEL